MGLREGVHHCHLYGKPGFAYKDGLFTGYDEAKRDYDKSTWDYMLGQDGFVVTDEYLLRPYSVWNLLKNHVSVYTPEMVERICGTPKEKFLRICRVGGRYFGSQ